MKHFVKRDRLREVLWSAGVSLATTIVTLAALEMFLRVADFRMLREGITERSLSYRYDAELGWAAVSGSSSILKNTRTIHVQHATSSSTSMPSQPFCFWEIPSFGGSMLRQMSASPTYLEPASPATKFWRRAYRGTARTRSICC